MAIRSLPSSVGEIYPQLSGCVAPNPLYSHQHCWNVSAAHGFRALVFRAFGFSHRRGSARAFTTRPTRGGGRAFTATSTCGSARAFTTRRTCGSARVFTGTQNRQRQLRRSAMSISAMRVESPVCQAFSQSLAGCGSRSALLILRLPQPTPRTYLPVVVTCNRTNLEFITERSKPFSLLFPSAVGIRTAGPV